jgi:signal transduction histidine kinase
MMANSGSARRSWDALVAPSTKLADIGDRERARMLSAFLVVLFGLGLLSGVVQLLAADHFLTTILSTAVALTGFAFAYWLSRTERYRAGAALAGCVVIGACVAARASHPNDHVWYAFMMIAVMLGSAFLSIRGASALAALAFVAVAITGIVTSGTRGASAWLPPLAVHAVFSPLLLVITHQRALSEERRSRVERERDRELLVARHLEAIGRMASGIAHDFTNQLAVVLGNSRLLLERRTFDEISINDMREAADRGLRLIQQLLAFAQKRPAEPEMVDLNQVLSDLQPILNSVVGGQIDLHIDRAPRLPSVKADPVQLERVLLNLAVNARDAMPDGGKLEIATATERAGTDGPGANSDGFVVLRVRDTGVGMDASTRASLFRPFFTTKRNEGGTGLGLAIVHGFVVESGGHIRVESELGRGTTFEIQLPSAPSA